MSTRRWSNCFAHSSVGRPGFVEEFGSWDDQKKAAAEQIDAGLDGIEFVRVVFCDIHGLARSKTVPAQVFRSVLRNGMDFSPGPFLFDTGHAVAVDFLSDDPQVGVPEIAGAGDFVLIPDPLTFQVLPHIEPVTAWVIGDEYLRDGTPHPLSARRTLRRIVQRYAAQELAPVVGLEVEWYLTRRLGGPAGNQGNGFGLQGDAPVVEAINSGYQFNLDSFYDSAAGIVDPLAMLLQSLGMPLRSMEHESGPGQMETTFAPMLAMDAADAMLLFRTVVKQYCARRSYHASFMTLPGIDGFDPSGWHLHQSVMNTRTGENIFAGADAPQSLSPEGKGYLEGLLDRARSLCMLSVPTVNGYRRMSPRFTLSPRSANWSPEDRSVMVRVLGEGASLHMENRVGEPCANPYFTMAAQLSAGLHGLAGDALVPGAPGEDAAHVAALQHAQLPGSLRESLQAFRDSSHAESLLGRPLASCLAKLKESELSRFEDWCAVEGVSGEEVTEWEQREYFGVF
ncbi:glutamine synthetase family protein [Streptomyces sp. NPDC005374]|uniref:glutamine synthetase family protein n=1 Tax=Streptomyces sp. NPDC005374 TaxID=3364713 RepID=UPI0036B771D7